MMMIYTVHIYYSKQGTSDAGPPSVPPKRVNSLNITFNFIANHRNYEKESCKSYG